MRTRTTNFRRRKESVKFQILAPVPLGFVFELAEHLAPICVSDRFRKAVIFKQIGDTESFNDYCLIFTNRFGGELVNVVLTLEWGLFF